MEKLRKALEERLVKTKYTKRTGSPGRYKYFYGPGPTTRAAKEEQVEGRIVRRGLTKEGQKKVIDQMRTKKPKSIQKQAKEKEKFVTTLDEAVDKVKQIDVGSFQVGKREWLHRRGDVIWVSTDEEGKNELHSETISNLGLRDAVDSVLTNSRL